MFLNKTCFNLVQICQYARCTLPNELNVRGIRYMIIQEGTVYIGFICVCLRLYHLLFI